MIRKIVWSENAEYDLYNILSYWIYHNQSATFSIKLEQEISRAVEAIAINPFIGKRSSQENTRLKLVRRYWIVYDIEPTQINILALFDTRQDDEQLKKRITKS